MSNDMIRKATAQPAAKTDAKTSMQAYIKQMQGEIKKALPAVMTPERFTRIVLSALSTNPKLGQTTPQSFLAALMTAAQLGMEPNTPLGQAYLIPFYNNKTHCSECQFQLGYKGLIDLAYRSGEVSIIRSLPGVDYIENEGPIPFMFNLTPEQQEFYKEKFQKKFDEVREKYFTGNYDLVVLDEVIDAYNLGTIQKEQLLEMMDKRPEGTELVITGHQYGMDISALTDRADYVTKFVKEKHPFDLGMPCRKGIEE